ncbi:rod shape-determining protein MreC [Phenylobacterium sp. Root77]|uniref:rod shape-determining protein MreC n=1 Tax=unclassified Phenylobacterium TaxID=2640670 RepID=UPI0006F761B8|nr:MULTISPECIES: rod shape-determining protein MreC [unclassified Phenylobacterium]KQW72149.1 rod shape-determining protein MreC [Phenylobacterium sp. Root1277]KQW95069.1 rod shape-determining protein MreC [Phenylobacterium sp. Root1290]KRC44762.1 rod shape-determining protein MreC [Phenylobacterium sp. Root77]
MALRENPFGELKVPLAWTAGVALVVAMVVALVLLMSDRRETFQTEAYGASRKVGDAIAAPVTGVLATPGEWIGNGVDGIRGYFFAVSENRRLKEELREARQWQVAALALRDTNDRYKALLGLKTDPPIPMVAARTVSEARGPFSNTRLANAGTEKGIQPGNPVMSENGVVGRIIGVTNGASRILLLTDIASRTPVMIDRTNARAILAGDGGPNPRLEYLRGQDPVKQGDRIVTSGDGGVLPRGLPVGVAVKGLDGRWRAVLASDAAPVDFVQVMLFQDFSQLAAAAAAELNRMPVPPPANPPPTVGVTSTPVAPAATAGAAAAPAAARPASAAPAATRPAAPRPAAPRPATPRPAPARPTPSAAPPTAPAAQPQAPPPAEIPF